MDTNYSLALDGAKYQWYWDFSLIPDIVKVIILRSSIGRVTDERFVENCKNAKDNGRKVGMYHWLNPWVETKDQMDIMKKQFELAPVDFIALDVEHAGQDVHNKIPPFYGQEKLSSKAYGTLQLIEREIGVSSIIYTRSTFVWDFMRPAATDPNGWMDKVPQWLASYPSEPSGNPLVTWEYFIEHVVPRVFSPFWYKLSVKYKNCFLWQFTSAYCLPGITSKEKRPTAMDVNLVHPDFFKIMKVNTESKPDENIPDPKPELTDSEKIRLLWEAHPELH